MKAIIFLLFSTLSLSSFAQKAFDFQYYLTKNKKFEVKLSLADGYLAASEIVVTDLGTKKQSKYSINLDGTTKSGRLLFSPDPKNPGIKKKRDNFIINKIDDQTDALPQKIRGSWNVDLSTYNFVFIKQ